MLTTCESPGAFVSGSAAATGSGANDCGVIAATATARSTAAPRTIQRIRTFEPYFYCAAALGSAAVKPPIAAAARTAMGAVRAVARRVWHPAANGRFRWAVGQGTRG